jgi:hypothetical protein
MALDGMARESTPAESERVKDRVFDPGVIEVMENHQEP